MPKFGISSHIIKVWHVEMQKAGEVFKPELIVYNAGTDILEGDSLGRLFVSTQKSILLITCWLLLIGLLYFNLIGDLFLYRCSKMENLNHKLLITGYSGGSEATRSNGVWVCKGSSCTNRHAHLRHVFPSDKLNFPKFKDWRLGIDGSFSHNILSLWRLNFRKQY